jgi:aryl-alcohol dehydrogenase-like predicted oxidoreductase
MEYRLLGGSGLKVSALAFGTATFGGANEFFNAWGATEVDEARRLIDICFDAGVNLFDTANGYSDGRSEEVLGKALEGKRDKALISTKSGFPTGSGPNEEGSSRYHLRRALEDSLRRLGTDYVDIYHLHGFDALTPIEEVQDTLNTFVREGKVRYIACSNFSGWHLMKSLACRGRALRLDALCRPPGLLLAHRPRIRVGVDAAWPGPESRRAGVESARLEPTDGQAAPRPALAGS